MVTAPHRVLIKSSKTLENKGFIAVFPPYPFIRFHLCLCFPRHLIMEKTRAQDVQWTSALCRPERSVDKKNMITSYNNKWQSGNCDICANILYWRISGWTSTFMTKATAFGTNCKAITICHALPYHTKMKDLSEYGAAAGSSPCRRFLRER